MKPVPIWRKWLKDPKKAERLYIVFWVSMVVVNVLIVLGFIMFLVLLMRW